MQRVLQEEWLDVLPPSDARAQRSRADLQRINFAMGNARRITRVLRETRAKRIADLGAGDGSFMRRVASRLAEVELTLVDRSPAGRAQLSEEWVIADAHEFLARPGPAFDAIVANLFLHHFADEPLRRLLALVARRTRLFVACEPRRSRVALHSSRLLWLLACNDVTRHDAAVSVRAGFRGNELSRLWPREPGWRLREASAPPFSHLFVASSDAL